MTQEAPHLGETLLCVRESHMPIELSQLQCTVHWGRMQHANGAIVAESVATVTSDLGEFNSANRQK